MLVNLVLGPTPDAEGLRPPRLERRGPGSAEYSTTGRRYRPRPVPQPTSMTRRVRVRDGQPAHPVRRRWRVRRRDFLKPRTRTGRRGPAPPAGDQLRLPPGAAQRRRTEDDGRTTDGCCRRSSPFVNFVHCPFIRRRRPSSSRRRRRRRRRPPSSVVAAAAVRSEGSAGKSLHLPLHIRHGFCLCFCFLRLSD